MSEYWQEFAQALLMGAIPYLVPVVVSVVASAFAFVWAKIKESKPNLAEAMEKAAKFGVYVAEQTGLKEQIALKSEEKLKLAIEKAEAYLATRGIKNFDLDLLVDAIEAEVLKASFPPRENK